MSIHSDNLIQASNLKIGQRVFKDLSGKWLAVGVGGVNPANLTDFSKVTATVSAVLADRYFYDSDGQLVQGNIKTVTPLLNGNTFTVGKGYVSEAKELAVPEAAITETAEKVTIGVGYIGEQKEYTLSSGEPDIDLSFITATSYQILSGYVGSDKDGNPVSGSIPVRNPSDIKQISGSPMMSIAAGYYYADNLALSEGAVSIQGNKVYTTEGYILNNEYTVGNAIPGGTIIPTTTDQVINAESYLTEEITVKGDSNFTQQNIAQGVTMWGKTGTHKGSTEAKIKPLTLTNVDTQQQSIQISLYKVGNPVVDGIQYRLSQKAQWQPYTMYKKIKLSPGSYIQFQNTNQQLSTSVSDYICTLASGYYQASGQMQSMLNYIDTCPDYCFYAFFYNGNKQITNYLTKPPKLSAKEVGQGSYFRMFQHCGSLTQAPQLPATKLGKLCYSYMFTHCNALTNTMTQLPAIELQQSCYDHMFQRCVNLAYAMDQLKAYYVPLKAYQNMFYGTAIKRSPKLNSTQMAQQACYAMCMDCKQLEEAGQLPATRLGKWAYSYTFSGCSNLTRAPELPGTELAGNCYRLMFQNCTAMTEPQIELPAQHIPAYCYDGMYKGCTNLTKTPVIKAKTGQALACNSMFQGCTNLSSIQTCFTTWDFEGTPYTTNWVKDVSATGQFKGSTQLSKTYGVDFIPEGWTYQYNDQNPLTLTATGTACTIIIRKTGQISNIDIEYKLDSQQTWQKLLWWDGGDSHTITLQDGQFVKFRNLTQFLSTSQTDYVYFLISGTVQASGNVMSMLNYAKKCQPFCFRYLFVNQIGLIKAPELPSLQLAQSCYQHMFQGTGITQMPQLPATKLAPSCYRYMFHNCASLSIVKPLKAPIVQDSSYKQMFSNSAITIAPEIKAVAMKDLACYRMFYSCKNLVNGPSQLNVQLLGQSSLNGMFQECNNLQTCFQVLPATVVPKSAYYCLFYRCYKFNQTVTIDAFDLRQSSLAYMFYECTSLTNKPIFTATNKLLGDYCYSNTFVGCSALTETPDIRGKVNGASDACYYRAFKNCTALTSVFDTITIPEAADWCCQQMFMGCTSLQNTPKIVINKLDSQCCFNMFNGCSNLNSISVQFTNWTVNGVQCFKDWVANVAAAGVFTCKGQLPIQFGASRIPWGWTVVNSETNQMIVQPEWYQGKQPVDMNGDGTINRDDFPQPEQPEVEQPALSTSSYLVTGAGTDQVNGTYTDSGQKLPNSEDIMYSNGSCYLFYQSSSGMSFFRKKPLSDGIAYYIAPGDFRTGAVQWSTNKGQEPLPSIMQI